MAMYVPSHLQWSNEMLNINVMNAESPSVELIVAIHFGAKSNEPDFDGGLSLFDKLYRKLSIFFEINWDVSEMKKRVRESNDSEEEYINVLKSILTKPMMECYGL